jgi:pyridoxamine 5'-phosphate oxidase
MDRPFSAPSRTPSAPWRERLRSLPVFPEELPVFDPDSAPDDPQVLAEAWLADAIDAGVLQPHAATWSTVDADGAPSSRTLILKDLTADGLWFATPSDSPMGRDLAGNSAIAMHLYWRELGRQLRVTGHAEVGSPEVSRADWAARSPAARAESDPATWSAYLLRPSAVEFFAADPRRTHLRLRYARASDGSWVRERLAA